MSAYAWMRVCVCAWMRARVRACVHWSVLVCEKTTYSHFHKQVSKIDECNRFLLQYPRDTR